MQDTRDSKPGVGAKNLLLGASFTTAHRCRKCDIRISDREYIASGLFLGLCPKHLASSLQTLRDGCEPHVPTQTELADLFRPEGK
jgi:hypothetical protein